MPVIAVLVDDETATAGCLIVVEMLRSHISTEFESLRLLLLPLQLRDDVEACESFMIFMKLKFNKENLVMVDRFVLTGVRPNTLQEF